MRRRTVLKGIAAATGAAAGPLIITERTIAQTRTIYVNTWGGSWTAAEEAAFFKPFTDQTGIRVKTVAPVSYAKLKAQVQSGSYEWDITAITQADLLRAEREGLVEPVDWTVVKKDKLFPNAVYANGLAYCALGTNLAYRKDKFPQGGPKSWADFWDVKRFPGNRSMLNNAVRTVQFALVADGVPVDKVFPLDIDRAFRKLDQIKPHIKVWWTQGNQSQQLVRDGEVDLIVMWNARAHAPLQLLDRRRQDEDADAVGVDRAHLLRSLPVDLQDQVLAPRQGVRDHLLRGAIAVAVHLGALEELATSLHREELGVGDEVVIDAVLFAGARLARGVGDGKLQARVGLHQRLDERGLARARRRRDHEQAPFPIQDSGLARESARPAA